MTETAMRMVAGAVCRARTGLNVRDAAGGAITATLRPDVLVELLAAPEASGWVRVRARGWTVDGKRLFFEPDERSGEKLTVRGGWRLMTVEGWVASRYLVVVDGPV